MSIAQAREEKLLTQKELMDELGLTSVRSVQRARKTYGLIPVDFYGNNPLFRPQDVEAVKKKRRIRAIQFLERQAKRRAK